MKKISLICALAAAAALSPACNDNENAPSGDGDGDNPVGDGDGDSPVGDGDGDNPVGDGDGDGDGGNGGAPSGDSCSDDVAEPGLGGAGGAALTCAAPNAPEDTIAILGTYTDNWDQSVVITQDAIIINGFSFAVSLVNNDQRYALAANGSEHAWNPCQWSKFAWFEDSEGLYYCQSAYDAASECDAEEASLPNSDDLDAGCGGFAWSVLFAD